MGLSILPSVNAALNTVATGLLIAWRLLIRNERVVAHRCTMISAFAVSSVFLGLYVLHKASRGFESLSYQATGALKAT